MTDRADMQGDTAERAERADIVAIIGCGAIGAVLGERLARDGCRVLGTTTTPAKRDELAARGIEPHVLDLGSPEGLPALLEGVIPRVVYLTVAAGRGRRDYREVYLEGARNLLRSLPSSVERIVSTSSIGVYGQDDGSWVDEDSPVEPSSANARILVETERALIDGARERSAGVTIVRLAGIWGPERGPGRLAARHAGTARADGDAWLNLVHEDDIVEALRRLRSRPYDGVLNLNDDEPTPRRVYYDAILSDAGLPPIEWREAPANEPPRLGKRVRNARIKEHLALELKHPRHHTNSRRSRP